MIGGRTARWTLGRSRDRVCGPPASRLAMYGFDAHASRELGLAQRLRDSRSADLDAEAQRRRIGGVCPGHQARAVSPVPVDAVDAAS
jgi:hypothetical protein